MRLNKISYQNLGGGLSKARSGPQPDVPLHTHMSNSTLEMQESTWKHTATIIENYSFVMTTLMNDLGKNF